MKSFPFVLGTDIVHLNRWDPIRKPRVVLGLARRTLHPKEYQNTQKIAPTLYEALLHHGPFEQFDPKSRSKIEDKDRELEACIFKDQLHVVSAARIRNFLAGRWAAKEAARKAWGAHLLGFKDVRVAADFTHLGDPNPCRSDSGSPGVRIICEPYWGPLNLNKEINFEQQQEGRLSISHDGDYVVATVIAESLNEEVRSLFEGRKAADLPLFQKHASSEV